MFIIKNMKAVFKAVATVFMLLAFVANGVCAEIPVKTGVSVDGRVAPAEDEDLGIKAILQMVQSVNSTCPIDIGNGVMLDSMSYANGVVKYNYLVSAASYATISRNVSLKESVYLSLKSNESFKSTAELLYSTETKLAYCYYTKDNKKVEILFSLEDLKGIFAPSGEVNEFQDKITLLQNLAKTEASSCPMDMKNGMVMTNVVYEDKKYKYTYMVTEQVFAGLGPETKELLLIAFKGTPEFKRQGKLLVETESTLLCHFFVGDGRSFDVEFSTEDIRNMLATPITDTDESQILEKLKNDAKIANSQCPIVLLEGKLTLAGVTFENKAYKYSYLVSDNSPNLIVDSMELKNTIIAELANNPSFSPFARMLVKTNSDLVYHYQSQSGKVRDIVFAPRELDVFQGKTPSRLTIEMTAKNLNAKCPMRKPDGSVVIESVTYELGVFKYVALLPDDIITKEGFASSMKNEFKESLRNLDLLEPLVDDNAKIVYHLHGSKGNEVVIELSNEELRTALAGRQ